MLTFIAFILTMLGSINWLMIGLLQYDFIAGLFGFQASIFSRICYILFGFGAVYLAIRMLVNKGSVKVFERKKKKEKQQAPATPVPANVEATKEASTQEANMSENFQRHNDFSQQENHSDSLFDEHLKKG